MPPTPPTFDPAKPADNALAEAAELRDQFNALKDLIDSLQSQIDERPDRAEVNQSIQEMSSANVNNLDTDTTTLHDPPTFDDLDAIRNTLNGLMLALKR